MNWQSCLSDMNKVFNMDETSFCVNPKLGKVLAKRGARNIYTISIDNEKDCYTVLLGGKVFDVINYINFSAKFPRLFF